jgi:hypothetical protein
MNVKLLAASALLVQNGALLVSHNCFINFFAMRDNLGVKKGNCPMSRQPKSAASRPPSYFNSTGGTSKGIVNLNSVFENADRLLEQRRTGSQYD